MTGDKPMSAGEIRAVFREAMVRHGGTKRGDRYAVPVGSPVNGEQPWIAYGIRPTGYGSHNCTITLDRWSADDVPETGRDWYKEHLHPFTRRATPKIRGPYWLTLPGISDYTEAVVLRSEVAPLLDLWIPKEESWHSQ